MGNRFVEFLIFSLLFFLNYQQTVAQNRLYNFRSYTEQNGLPTNKINDIEQDRQGLLWMATNKGLISYDGIRFNSVNLNTATSKYSNDFSSIFVDSYSPRIWLTTYNDGLICYDRSKPLLQAVKKITAIVNEGKLIKDELYDVIVSKNNLVYFGGQETDLQVYNPKVDSSYVIRLSKSKEYQTIYSLKEDSSGKIWIGTRYGGIYIYEPQTGKINVLDLKNKGENAASGFTFVGHTAYFSYYNYDLLYTSNINKKQITGKSILGLGHNKNFYDNYITSVGYVPDENKIIAAHITNGIYAYDINNKKIEHIPWNLIAPEKNVNTRINKVLVTKTGYFIASNDGLYFYSALFNKINQFIPTQFLIKDLFKVNNKLWYWSDQYIGQISEDLLEVKSKIHLQNLKVSQINVVNNIIYLSTYDKGVYELDPVRNKIIPLQIVNQKYGFDVADCNKVVRDLINGEEYLWIGSWSSGLYLYNVGNKKIKLYNTSNGLQDNKVISVGIDMYNNVWLGTDGYGIVHVRDKLKGKFEFYHHSDNDNLSPISNTIFTFLLDQRGNFWYGSTSSALGGIIKQNSGNYFFKGINNDNTHNWMYIRKLKEDIYGKIWMQTNEGIIVFNPIQNSFRYLQKNDGIYPMSIFKTHNYFFDKDKIVWMTNKGFIKGLLKNAEDEQEMGKPIISTIKIFGVDHSDRLYNKRIIMKSDENSFSFDLAAPKNINIANANIYYKLEDVDKDWVLANSYYQAVYTNIDPGDYSFRIRVEDKDNKTLQSTSSFQISILAKWYETMLFKITLSLLVISLVVGFLLYRLEQHKAINKLQVLFNEQLRIQLKENEHKIVEQTRKLEIGKQEQLELDFRKKLYESELKAIRSQMNPHFIFNVLNSIEAYVVENNKLLASKMIHKFASLTRIVLDNSQLSIVELESEIELVKLYLELEQERFGYKFDYEFVIAQNLDTKLIRIPSMVIQPIVENAIHHGIRHLVDKRGLIRISLNKERKNIIINVLDNGVGFVTKNSSISKKDSFGIRGVDNRLKMLNHRNSECGIFINLDEIESPYTTKVTMVFPGSIP